MTDIPFSPARDCRIARDVRVPMRDGVELATTILLPPGEGAFPVVLVRTAYNRLGWAQTWFAERGMGLVVQDCRGRYDSGGEWVPFLSEPADGRDALAWIASQPWSSGRIGMFGDSYLAATQFAAAMDGAEFLTALNPRFMSGDCWKRGYYCDGAFSLALTWSWLCYECDTRTSEASLMPLWDVGELLRALPLRTLDVASGGRPNPFYREYAGASQWGETWASLNVHDRLDRFTMPVLLTAGWYDNYAAEAARTFTGLVDAAATDEAGRGHRLLIGPWSHGIQGSSELGEMDFGPEATRENDSSQRWLECTLAGGGPAAFSEAPVRLFVMGANAWRDEWEWPLARTEYRPMYLRAGGGLSFEAPGAEPADTYRYDPADPVPTLGGNHSVGPYNPGLYEIARPGPFDQRPVEARADVLVYTSTPLDEDLEVTGPVVVKLFAASSCPDTDFVARLVDVHPDGRAMSITEGVLRARFRGGVWARPELMTPGVDYEFTIDLQVTSNVFARGHRIRLDVTSSSFPLWDRNLNTGGDPATETAMRIADQTLHHDAVRPSHVLLPTVPAR